MNRDKILVWDLPTRLFHWLLAGTFAGAWLTAIQLRSGRLPARAVSSRAA